MRIRALFLIASVFLTSCMEELEDIDKAEIGTLNPDVALPLVNSNFTLSEFLEQGNSLAEVSEENGVVLLTYADTVISQSASSLFQVEDQVSPDVVISGTTMSTIPNNSSATFTRSRTFSINASQGDQLDSIQLSAGDLTTSIEVNAPVSGSVKLTFSSIEKNGQSIEQTLSWTFDGTNSNQTITDTEDLTNASIILNGSGGTNEISFTAEVTITNEGTPVSNTNEVRLFFGLTDLDFRGVYGDIVNRPIQTPEKSEQIDIFNNINEGTFELDDPRMKVTFNNSFGIPVELSIASIRAEAKDGSIIPLSGDILTTQEPVQLSSPTFNEIGESKSTSIEVNSQNSNLDEMLNSLPASIIYSFPGEIDPDDLPNNFILDESEIDIFVDIELPLSGTISGLVLSKRFDFDGNGISELNTATLLVNTSNTFPLDGWLQVYFLDDASNTLDSLYDDSRGILMTAGELDTNGFVSNPGLTEDRVDIDQTEIDNIDQATQLVMRVILRTNNAGATPIKIALDNSLQVNIGIESELEIN